MCEYRLYARIAKLLSVCHGVRINRFVLSWNRKGELRRRTREKKERLAAQVREMKRRQKETEDWQKLKRSLYKPLTIGIGIGIGGGIIALCGYYLYMRS